MSDLCTHDEIDHSCTCPGPGAYNHECPVGIKPHYVRASEIDTTLFIKIELLSHIPTEEANSVSLYVINVISLTGDQGLWTETFGSADTAAAFMSGIRAGLAMVGSHSRMYSIPIHNPICTRGVVV